ncbi:MAG: helix-turn-helix domain-containing protein [Burkholderiaceae bacterium]
MLTKVSSAVMPLERFQADLKTICGSFGVIGGDRQLRVQGGVSLETLAGIEIAHVAKDVQTIRRTERDIRRDAGENFFLIVQEEGQAFMRQHDTMCMLKPGDMLLVDSATPSEFMFFGKFSRQLSLHLPRREMFERFGCEAAGGHFVGRKDYHSVAIAAILAKAFEAKANQTQSAYLREAIFGLIGAMLYERSGVGGARRIDAEVAGAQLLERCMAVIDQCHTDSELTTQTLAEMLGTSARQLQRAFAMAGTTPTEYLLTKRLERACQMLIGRRGHDEAMLISSIAYACGFNDVSYFNRQFRRLFGCAPGQFGATS